jgi:hypothetical protein
MAARRTAAPPVSVRMKCRSGVWTLRDQAVSPEKDASRPFPSRIAVVLLREKLEERPVDLLWMRPRDVMRPAFDPD